MTMCKLVEISVICDNFSHNYVIFSYLQNYPAVNSCVQHPRAQEQVCSCRHSYIDRPGYLSYLKAITLYFN